MLLPVNGNKLNLNTGAPAGSDTFKNGLRYAGSAVRASTGLTVNNYSQGLPVDANGVLCLVDATLGLPAATTYQNGFPMTANGLCISTGTFQAWQYGVPFDANGAVCT
jgi:hypothetical protein